MLTPAEIVTIQDNSTRQARVEFQTVTCDNQLRSGTGVVFIPKLVNITAGQVGEIIDLRGIDEVGQLIEIDFGFDPSEKKFRSDHLVSQQQRRNQEAARIKALLGYIYQGEVPSKFEVNKLPSNSLVKTEFQEWERFYNATANIVEFSDRTDMHDDRGFGSFYATNGDIRVGLGVACSPGHDNTMRNFFYQILQKPLQEMLGKK